MGKSFKYRFDTQYIHDPHVPKDIPKEDASERPRRFTARGFIALLKYIQIWVGRRTEAVRA